ncbi:MAG TPA: hypothetical protein VK919_13345 [Solirubrobacterales bacterium]|nr:hypothetical protein [Solirubrobacterales bacterium]
MKTATANPGRWRRWVGVVCAVALACVMALGAEAASAQNEATFSFDEARVNLGDQKGLPLIDPGIPDPPATLTADVDPATGELSAPAAGFDFPGKVLGPIDVTDPIPLTVDALIEFDPLGPIAGTFDAATGELNLSELDVSATVSVCARVEGAPTSVCADPPTADPPLGICIVSPISLALATTGEIVDDTDPENPITYPAAPFTPQGAAVTTWTGLPESEGGGGAADELVCPAVDGLLGGPGGIWLSGLAEHVHGDPGLGLRVKPKRKKVRAGKAATFRTTVNWIGLGTIEGVRVCARAPKKKAKVRGGACRTVASLTAGEPVAVPFKVKSKRKARGKARITFRARHGASPFDGVAVAILKIRRR